MKKIIVALMLNFFITISAHAGTVGVSGQWNFDGLLTMYDTNGVLNSTPVTGFFDFSSSNLDLDFQLNFFGQPITYTGGTLSDNGDGTYNGLFTFDWSIYTDNTATILWDITDNGNGTATVLTLDGDDDGIPGNTITNGTFTGSSFEINGELTTVPLPAAFWLLSSGLIGLIGIARRKAHT